MTAAPTMPTWQQIRRKLGVLAKSRGEWAGIPLPVTEAPLVVAKRHPMSHLNGVQLEQEPRQTDDEQGLEFVNEWYDPKRRVEVIVFRDQGKLCHAVLSRGPGKRAGMLLHCIGVSQTMDIEAERRAMKTLRELIPKHLADAYEMTGTFLESSKRSGVVYLFRRLATTIAFRPDNEGSRVLAALCLHPLAYYEGLPMGVMVPTDDVIAHLVLMRTDEHLFWRKANQHGVESPGALL